MRRLYAAVLLGLVCLPLSAMADDDEVRAILDKAAKAMGGEEALKKAEAFAVRGHYLHLLSGGRSYESEVLTTVQGSDRSRTEYYNPGQPGAPGERTAVCVITPEGEWLKYPREPVVKYDDEAVVADDRLELIEEAAVTNLGPLRDGTLRVEVVGEEPVGGDPASVLKATAPGGRSFTIAFDKGTGLPVRVVHRGAGNGRDRTKTTTFRDYRDFGGLKVATPRTWTVDVVGGPKLQVGVEVTEFKVLDKVDPKTFAKPE